MVYYGVLSKGCQRCRQRKVKCDERKPSCQRCEKLKVPCPGFRNLSNILFRDESGRVAQRSQAAAQAGMLSYRPEPELSVHVCNPAPVHVNQYFPARLQRPLSQPLSEVAANFYFCNYSYGGPPLSAGFYSWVARVYSVRGHPLGSIIEAIGMAAISNIRYAPEVAAGARESYGRVLAATTKVLSAPAGAITDMTLMTVLLLGLYEFVSFESWDQYNSWDAHIRGAAALLQLQGHRKSESRYTRYLFALLRSQCLYSCMQRATAAPDDILRMHQTLASNSGWGNGDKPLGHLSFRLSRLRAAATTGGADTTEILETAIAMDRELDAWAGNVPENRKYTVTNPQGSGSGSQRHVYSSIWAAQTWNNYRTLRILVRQLIVPRCKLGERGTHVALIRRLSGEVCVSAGCYQKSPMIMGLIWPLTVVAEEELNADEVRRWAIRELRNIGSSIGHRQARLIADTVEEGMGSGTDVLRG